MINFYPTWVTPAGTVATVMEGAQANYTLQAVEQATFMASNAQATFDCGYLAQLVSNVMINNQNVDYTITGNSVEIVSNVVITNTSVVQITANQSLNYSLLYNPLPPGLLLSNSGLISGTVGSTYVNNTVTYTFAVRVTDGIYSRDRQFSINISPVVVELNPPAWGSLPSLQVQQAAPNDFVYIPLGDAFRGMPFSYQIPIFQPGGPPTLVVDSVLEIAAPFNNLPSGITVQSNTGLISGTIGVDDDLGEYFFTITMLDSFGNAITVGSAVTPYTFMIDVAPPFEPFSPLGFVEWITPPGSLGTVSEGEVFPVGVQAVCTTNAAVSYALVSGSSLPPGLTLDTSTGNIEGIVGYVPVNETFTFSIKAYVGQIYETRTFSISVLSRYSSGAFLSMNFVLRAKDTLPMVPYYANVIEYSDYFRPTDTNFGTVANNVFSIYLIGGLNGEPDTFEAVVRNSKFDAPVKLYLGNHNIAYAQMNGVTVYEVLYRDVIDPLSNVGGYSVNNGVPTSDPIVDPLNSETVYTTSIDNIRYEFVTNVGFATANPAYTNSLSLSAGVENLPLWMSNSGYIPAMVVAYLAPGHGQDVLNRISVIPQINEDPYQPSVPTAIGHEVYFDQYYVLFQTISDPTTFDNATTTFDSGNLIFDAFATTEADLYRMNRPKFNTVTYTI